MKLSLIVPAYNEEANIAEVVSRIETEVTLPHELLVVNDHSQDRTGELLHELCRRYPNLRVVENKRPRGFANALSTGFAYATGDFLLPVMADLCDDLATIPLLFEKITQGYDIACGCRYTKGGARQGGAWLKGWLSSMAGRSLNFFLGLPTADITNAFKMYRRQVIEQVPVKAKGFEISMEIPLKAYYRGYTLVDVPTVWHERTRGKSSFRVFKLLPSYLRLYLWAFGQKRSRK